MGKRLLQAITGNGQCSIDFLRQRLKNRPSTMSAFWRPELQDVLSYRIKVALGIAVILRIDSKT